MFINMSELTTATKEEEQMALTEGDNLQEA